MNEHGAVIVSWSFQGDDASKHVLLVGKKVPGRDVVPINAFQGVEARELYLKLTKPKEGKNG